MKRSDGSGSSAQGRLGDPLLRLRGRGGRHEGGDLGGYTGLCPLVRQSGNRDVRGPLSKNGPKYLRWALIEAPIHAARHPVYRGRYERMKERLGRQRGAKVARVDLARQLAEAIWYVLTKREPFAPAGPTIVLVA